LVYIIDRKLQPHDAAFEHTSCAEWWKVSFEAILGDLLNLKQVQQRRDLLSSRGYEMSRYQLLNP